MDDDLIVAVIALLRADATLNSAVSGRFFPIAQVPPNAAFPRCYVGVTGRVVEEWMEGAQYRVRHPRVQVLWATTNATPSANQVVERLDARTDLVLRTNLPACANLTFLQRDDSVSPYSQDVDNTEYIVGGGIWYAYREYEYYGT